MKRPWISRVFLVVVLTTAIIWALANRGRFETAAVESWIKDFGIWGPAIFAGLYALATVLFLPGSIFSLAGGMLFGPLWGTAYNLTGATIGATIAFLASRYLLSDWVARRAGGWLGRLVAGIEAEGWRFVAFVRLVPLFPFNLLNYALGLTRIRLSHYVLASFICMFPGGLAYTYLGYAGREAVAGSEDAVQTGLLALGLLAAVVFLPRIVKRLRGAATLTTTELKRRLDKGNDLLVLDVRGEDEYSGPLGHIPGSSNIAVSDLQARFADLSQFRDRQVAVICRAEKKSYEAARLLGGAGFTQVPVVRGCMVEWNCAGFPVET